MSTQSLYPPAVAIALEAPPTRATTSLRTTAGHPICASCARLHRMQTRAARPSEPASDRCFFCEPALGLGCSSWPPHVWDGVSCNPFVHFRRHLP